MASKKSKQLLICSPQLGMSEFSSLGGEIYDYQTIKGFTEKGFQVLVYLPKNRQYNKNLKNLKVTYAPITHIAPPWIYSFLMLPYLYKTYKKTKFDVLRIHSPRFLGLGALIFKLSNPNVPILANAVNVDDSPYYFLIEKLLFKSSSGVIVQSKYMKDRLIKRFQIPENKVAVTYGGILDNAKKVIKDLEVIAKKDQIILFMGVMVKRKNPEFLLDVFKMIFTKVPNAKLVFIGNGPEKGKLVRRVVDEDLGNRVIFIDRAYGEDKAAWLSRMDVFALPSKDEGFGLVVTEAMSYGKPVITSNQAAFPEIIQNGKEGYAISLNDKDLWAKVMVRILKDKTKAKRLGNCARKRVKRDFNWEKTYGMNAQFVKGLVK